MVSALVFLGLGKAALFLRLNPLLRGAEEQQRACIQARQVKKQTSLCGVSSSGLSGMKFR